MRRAHERMPAHVLEVRQRAAGLWFPVVDGTQYHSWGGFATPSEAYRYGRAVAALDRTDGTYSLPRQEVKR